MIDKLVDKLTNNAIIILKKVEDNLWISKLEIASLLGMDKTTTQNAIVKFQKLNLIERIGSNKTEYWKDNKYKAPPLNEIVVYLMGILIYL